MTTGGGSVGLRDIARRAARAALNASFQILAQSATDIGLSVTGRNLCRPIPSAHRRNLAHSMRMQSPEIFASTEGRKAIARASGERAATRELLDPDHVCLEIVRYLLGNGEAADTARGIAEWWINRDVSRTAEALSRLQELGNPLLCKPVRQSVDRLSQPTSTEVR